jgi:hypothetical protein
MNRFPLYGHTAAGSRKRFLNKVEFDKREKKRQRTNLRSIYNFIMFERIKVVLDIYRSAFFDGTRTEEWVRLSRRLSEEVG